MDLAARFYQQSAALAAPGIAVPFITPDVIASFAQINQTIRRAILVSRKLAEPLPPAPSTIRGQDTTRKRHTSEAGEQNQSGPEPTQPETVRAEHGERLLSPDLEDRIGNRPIPEIIAAMCRALGMDPNAGTVGHPAPQDAEPPVAHAAQPIEPGAPPLIQRADDNDEALAMVRERFAPATKSERRPPEP